MDDSITKLVLGAVGLLVTYFIKSILDNLKKMSRMEAKVDKLTESLQRVEKLIDGIQEFLTDYKIFKNINESKLESINKRIVHLEEQCEKCKEKKNESNP